MLLSPRRVFLEPLPGRIATFHSPPLPPLFVADYRERKISRGPLSQHLRSLFIYFIPGKVTEPAGRSCSYRSHQRFSGPRGLPGQGFPKQRANLRGPVCGDESCSPAARVGEAAGLALFTSPNTSEVSALKCGLHCAGP